MQSEIKSPNSDNQVPSWDSTPVSYGKPNIIRDPFCENCSCVSGSIFEICQNELPADLLREQHNPASNQQQSGGEMRPTSRIVPFQVGKENLDNSIIGESTPTLYPRKHNGEESKSALLADEFNAGGNEPEINHSEKDDLSELPRELPKLNSKTGTELLPVLQPGKIEPVNQPVNEENTFLYHSEETAVEIKSASIVSDYYPEEIESGLNLSEEPVNSTGYNETLELEVESKMESVPEGTVVFEPCSNQTGQKSIGMQKPSLGYNEQSGLEVENRIQVLEEKIIWLESEILRLGQETEAFKNRSIIKLSGSIVNTCGCGV
ncbi:MAG: hypothetical protein ABFD08_04270 [Syntrophomonas sp.]